MMKLGRFYYSPLSIIAHAECIDPTNLTTDMIMEPISASSELPGELSCQLSLLIMMRLCLYTVGGVIAIIVGVVLIIFGLSTMLAIVFTLKLKNDKHQRVKQSLKSQIR